MPSWRTAVANFAIRWGRRQRPYESARLQRLTIWVIPLSFADATQQQQAGTDMTAVTIDDVIHDLSSIIDASWQQNSRLGFFPAMYRKVTVRIKEGVENGRFQNPPLMEHLDVVFANRYIEAYWQYRQGQQPTRAWAYTFDRAQDPHPSVLHHLLLGMNAHINLDLGIAAAQVCHDCPLDNLQSDFFAVNQVLAGLLDEVQEGVNQSSRLFRLVDSLGGQADETLGNFSLRRARQSAWEKAQALHPLPLEAYPTLINHYDRATLRLAQLICPPVSISQVFTAVASPARLPEPRDIIDTLV
ncbi:MAG: hypothetical protein IPM39_14090 [Chloroflexi bacterium]|nr:hypothetical protein [Chloroflexota bacterium]